MAEQKAVCGGFLVGDGLEFEGKTLKATGSGNKFYTFIVVGDGYRIVNAGADIESIMANGGFTIYSPQTDEEEPYYSHFIFGGTGPNSIYGLEYSFIESGFSIDEGVTFDYLPFVIDGNDLIQFIEEP